MTHPSRHDDDFKAALDSPPESLDKGDRSYVPRPNSLQAQSLPDDISEEYLRFLDFSNFTPKRISEIAARVLAIRTDTSGAFEMHPGVLWLEGGAVFVFNALWRFRTESDNPQPVSAAEILGFGNGFRSHSRDSDEKLAPPFARAVQALDAAIRVLTGGDLVSRNTYGSGSNVQYELMPDIGVRDERP